MKKIIILVVVLSGLFVAGCFLEDSWPTTRDRSAVLYADPNAGDVGSLAMLKTVRQDKTNIDIKHIRIQEDLLHRLNIDNQTYAIVADSVTSNIRGSKQSYNTIIGALEQPGWLMTLGLSALSAYGIKIYKDNTMYSEAEHQAELKKKTPQA